MKPADYPEINESVGQEVSIQLAVVSPGGGSSVQRHPYIEVSMIRSAKRLITGLWVGGCSLLAVNGQTIAETPAIRRQAPVHRPPGLRARTTATSAPTTNATAREVATTRSMPPTIHHAQLPRLRSACRCNTSTTRRCIPASKVVLMPVQRLVGTSPCNRASNEHTRFGNRPYRRV